MYLAGWCNNINIVYQNTRIHYVIITTTLKIKKTPHAQNVDERSNLNVKAYSAVRKRGRSYISCNRVPIKKRSYLKYVCVH